MRTDAARVSRNAVAAATRAGPAPRAGRHSTGNRPLRPRTGLALIAIGLVLLLAVRVHTASVDLQAAGFVLAAVGVTWLWVPVRDKKALLRRHVGRAINFVSWDASDPTAHGTLAELFEGTGNSGTAPGGTARQGLRI